LKKYFEELTEEFLSPLQKCFDSLWYTSTDENQFLFQIDITKIFKQEKFYNFICKNGYPKKLFVSNDDEVLEFYKKFIFSVNFNYWLNNNIKKFYINDVLFQDFKKIVKNNNESKNIDLFLRILNEVNTLNQNVTFLLLDNFVFSTILNYLNNFLQIIKSFIPSHYSNSLLKLNLNDKIQNVNEKNDDKINDDKKLNDKFKQKIVINKVDDDEFNLYFIYNNSGMILKMI
jgi:hypothetical protein